MEQASMFDLLIKIIVGIAVGIGTAVVALNINLRVATRKERTSLATSLFNELFGQQMAIVRHKAGSLIREFPVTSIDELEKIDRERALNVLLVMRFYRRLWFSIKHKQIDTKLIDSFFADNFYNWYYISFNKNVPSKWEAKSQLDSLAEWFEKTLPSSRHHDLKAKREQEFEDRINALSELKEEDVLAETKTLIGGGAAIEYVKIDDLFPTRRAQFRPDKSKMIITTRAGYRFKVTVFVPSSVNGNLVVYQHFPSLTGGADRPSPGITHHVTKEGGFPFNAGATIKYEVSYEREDSPGQWMAPAYRLIASEVSSEYFSRGLRKIVRFETEDGADSDWDDLVITLNLEYQQY